jgi:hypothetical protein
MHCTLHTCAQLVAALHYSLCNCLLAIIHLSFVCVYLQGAGAVDSSSTGAAADDGLDAKTRMKEHGMYTLFALLIASQLQ